MWGSCGEKLLHVTLNHRHRYIEGFAIDGNSHSVLLDGVGACYTIAREVSGMLVAIKLNVILRGDLLCPLDELHGITFE